MVKPRDTLAAGFAAVIIIAVLVLYSSQTLSTHTVTVVSTAETTQTVETILSTIIQTVFPTTVTVSHTVTRGVVSVEDTTGSQAVLCTATLSVFIDTVAIITSESTITVGDTTSTETFTSVQGNSWASNSWTFVGATNSTDSVGAVVSNTTIYSAGNLLSTPTQVNTCTYLP